LTWWCLAVSLCGLLSAAEPTPGADARALLEKAQAAYRNRPAVIFDDELVARTFDGKKTAGGVLGSRYLTSFRRDGQKIDLVTRRIALKENGQEEATYESRHIWDGKMHLHRQRPIQPDAKPMAFLSYKAPQDADFFFGGGDDSGAYLDGVFPGHRDHYTTVMLRSRNLTLHESPEEIGGHPCRVVEGDTEKGHYKVWIDVNCGYGFRQVEIQERKESLKESLYTMQDVRWEEIQGVWFPAAGTARGRWVYQKGGVDDFRYEMTRRNVVFHPDFDKIGAFRMDLPEGTHVIDLDDHSTSYVWYEDKAQDVRKVHERLIGRPAPPLAVERWYNVTAASPDLEGKVVLLDFFGVWCRPCMAQIPHIKSLWEKYASQGLVVIGMHTPLEKEGIAAFLARDQVSYPIAVDLEGKTARAYTVFFYPTVVVLDRRGQVRAMNPPQEQLGDLLESLLKRQP
jgi:thiol-disulfide isomerase/thioredoxin